MGSVLVKSFEFVLEGQLLNRSQNSNFSIQNTEAKITYSKSKKLQNQPLKNPLKHGVIWVIFYWLKFVEGMDLMIFVLRFKLCPSGIS